MALPAHRRTSSDKRRRASHFALKKQNLTEDAKTGLTHRPHRVAPGATEYRGHEVHIKGKEKKLERLLKNSQKPDEQTKSEAKK
ncbi:50S ribosomal protein L32 [Candidatus Uhrbacteria bacterium]|nr:50S ribosomal protein L32 [Candidatus Uhrbacteria bacterium]